MPGWLVTACWPSSYPIFFGFRGFNFFRGFGFPGPRCRPQCRALGHSTRPQATVPGLGLGLWEESAHC